jgi:hypothetical protein
MFVNNMKPAQLGQMDIGARLNHHISQTIIAIKESEGNE